MSYTVSLRGWGLYLCQYVQNQLSSGVCRNHRGLPADSLLGDKPYALILLWIDLVAGVLLILGIRTKSSAAVIGFLLLVFSLVILVTMVRDLPIGLWLLYFGG